MTTSARPDSGTGQPDARDRERAREARGIRSSATAASTYRSEVPKPPHRRRPMMALLAVLLIVGGAAFAGLLAVRLDSREQVMVLARDVPAGTRITAGLLAETPVASEGLQLVPADQVDAVIGTWTRVSISRGQLLDTSMLTRADPVDGDRALVGVPLRSGRVPPGLRSGDLVRVVRIGDGTTPLSPLAVGLVLETVTDTSEGLAGEGGSTSRGTLLVPTSAADAVVDAAGNDQLGLSLVRRSIPVDEAPLQDLGGGD
jgi:hypothetical protein